MRLPSLTGLRAFEAVARHGSLTRAADELSVTPGAIGHQIRGLEADLGVKLLEKSGGAMVPTEAAQSGLPHLRTAFDALAEANRRLRTPRGGRTLMVSAVPSFVSSWLIPRLQIFNAHYPDLTVHVDTSWGITDFHRAGVDLAIRFGSGGWSGVFEKRLFWERLFPVCSPRLLEGDPPLEKPEDLARHTLLHSMPPSTVANWPGWPQWLAAAGIGDIVDGTSGTSFTRRCSHIRPQCRAASPSDQRADR